jgi:hypothetical protein
LLFDEGSSFPEIKGDEVIGEEVPLESGKWISSKGEYPVMPF